MKPKVDAQDPAAALQTAEKSNRINFLDNLRAFVIACVVVLHGSITYMDYAPQWWYVVNPQHATFFRGVVYLIDVPIMLIMFFIAAYFLLPSLMKRNQMTFLKDKFLRIGVPWIAGVLLLTPPTVYIRYYSRHIPVPLARLWTADFWTPRIFEQSVYWFLGVLFFFLLLFNFAYRSTRKLQSLPSGKSHPTWKIFPAFWAIMTLGMFIMLGRCKPDDWYGGWYVLSFQPARVPAYIGYFVLGIAAYRGAWFSPGGYSPRLVPWSALCVLSGLLYLANQFEILRVVFNGKLAILSQSPLIARAVYAVLWNTFCFSSLMAGAAFFQRFINGRGRIQKNFAESSYGIYYIHPLILYPLAYLFIGISLPLYWKAASVIVIALLLSWAISAFILRKAPLLKRMF